MENHAVVVEKKIDNKVQPIAEGSQLMLSTWVIVAILVVVFLILKKVIYLKDVKRDGK